MLDCIVCNLIPFFSFLSNQTVRVLLLLLKTLQQPERLLCFLSLPFKAHFGVRTRSYSRRQNATCTQGGGAGQTGLC